MGYKVINNLLGLIRDSVRGFCKRNSLSGDSCVVALNVEEKVKRNVLCDYCENPLKQKSTGRMIRFCCDDCRRKWWKEHKVERKKNKDMTVIGGHQRISVLKTLEFEEIDCVVINYIRIEKYLEKNPNITNLILCLDSDDEGNFFHRILEKGLVRNIKLQGIFLMGKILMMS